MAITSSRVLQSKWDPTATAFKFTAGEKIWAGYPVVINPANGTIMSITTDGYVAGIVTDDAESGATVKVKTGIWELPSVAGVNAVDVGQAAYITDDGAVATVSSAGQLAGVIVAVERSGWAFVKFDFPVV
jgi:hypothetical protein